MMIALLNASTNQVISMHRTVEAAEKAEEKHRCMVERVYGGGAYFSSKLIEGKGLKKGMWISRDEIHHIPRVKNSWED